MHGVDSCADEERSAIGELGGPGADMKSVSGGDLRVCLSSSVKKLSALYSGRPDL